MTICDPACGTGAFLLAAYEWIVRHTEFLDPEQREHLRFHALKGWEIVESSMMFVNAPVKRAGGPRRGA
jgi:type I restriction enzyme M protein